MYDIMEKIAGATIQHGVSNNRVYLMKMGDAEPDELIEKIAEVTTRNGYTKVFAKVPHSQMMPFLDAGYQQEASIPCYYNGKEAVHFLCSYPDSQREVIANADTLDEIMIAAREKQNSGIGRSLREDATLRICGTSDVNQMADIYKTVFPTYPFPIHDPDYLLETMDSHVIYFGIEISGKLVALSSAEMDRESQSVEMTDFATRPEWLGNGFAVHLLIAMESEMHKQNIKTAYTIARAESAGMNITFARLGYTFGGRLANNTQISGCIESMNVWYKSL